MDLKNVYMKIAGKYWQTGMKFSSGIFVRFSDNTTNESDTKIGDDSGKTIAEQGALDSESVRFFKYAWKFLVRKLT